MGQLRTSWNLTKPRAGFFLPTCVETHYQLPAKALTSLLSPRVPWWFWGLSWHMIPMPRVNKEADKKRSCFFWHCHDIASQYDSGSWFFTKSHDTFFGSMCYCAILLCWPKTCCGISSFSIYIVFRNGEGEIRDFTRHICLNPLVSLQHHASNRSQLRDLSSFHFCVWNSRCCLWWECDLDVWWTRHDRPSKRRLQAFKVVGCHRRFQKVRSNGLPLGSSSSSSRKGVVSPCVVR